MKALIINSIKALSLIIVFILIASIFGFFSFLCNDNEIRARLLFPLMEIGLLVCITIANIITPVKLWDNPYSLKYKWILIGLVIGLITYFVSNTEAYIFEFENRNVNIRNWNFIIAELILAPIIEELFFRKWIITYMEKLKLPTIFIVAVSTISFWSLHVGFYRFDVIILAISNCIVFLKTRDIRYCIIAHFFDSVLLGLYTF